MKYKHHYVIEEIAMKSVKIGKFVVPLWLVAAILVFLIGTGALGYYLWTKLSIPLEIEEPIEVLDYPSKLSLYPGENKSFQISIMNHASVNYSVVLDFSLDNVTYQDNYVSFSNTVYAVMPGQQDLEASMTAVSYAPPANVSLVISFSRDSYPYGLIGYWRFNEGTGILTFDRSGKNNHGAFVNGPTWVDGRYGKAIRLDGLDDYVLIGSSDSIEFSKSITVSSWVKVNSATGDHQVIVSHWKPPEWIGFVLEFAPDGVTSQFAVEITTGTRVYAYSAIPVTVGSWVHLTGVFDGTSVKIYVNGTLAGESTLNGSVDLKGEPILVGANLSPGDWNWFNGIIDEVKVYNRVLSAAEVATIYTESSA